MKEKIRKLACEQRWHPQHLVEALEALAEDTFGAVPVFLEFDPRLPFKLAERTLVRVCQVPLIHVIDRHFRPDRPHPLQGLALHAIAAQPRTAPRTRRTSRCRSQSRSSTSSQQLAHRSIKMRIRDVIPPRNPLTDLLLSRDEVIDEKCSKKRNNGRGCITEPLGASASLTSSSTPHSSLPENEVIVSVSPHPLPQ